MRMSEEYARRAEISREHEGPDQEEEAREASSLVVFVVVSMVVAVIATWAGILSGRV